MHALTEGQISYDPYNVEIDADPYPTYRRLRDESPLYYNERFDFWALSRFTDVDDALRDIDNLSSAKGDILEVVKAEPVMPAGVFINEDPPLHTMHRLLVSRAFTPRKMKAIEDQVRAFCAACLDPLSSGDRLDFTVDLGAQMPMRVIGMLVGMPDSLQRSVRKVAGQRLRNKPGEPLPVSKDNYFNGNMFRDYVQWREQNPSDDLVTELLAAEFRDVNDEVRRLSTEELLVLLGVIANAGTETVGRLFGWLGKLLGEYPDQRRQLVENPDLIASAVEEVLRFEPPVHNIARYVAKDVEYHGHTVPAGKLPAADDRRRQPRRAAHREPRPLRHPAQRQSPGVRARYTFLPRRLAGPAGRPGRPRGDSETLAGLDRRHGQRGARAHRDRPGLGQHADNTRLTEAPSAGVDRDVQQTVGPGDIGELHCPGGFPVLHDPRRAGGIEGRRHCAEDRIGDRLRLHHRHPCSLDQSAAASEHTGFGDSRADGMHRNAFRRQVGSDGPHETDDGVLAQRVDRVGMPGQDAGQRRGRHDRASTGGGTGPHRADGGPGAEDNAVEVHLRERR